MRNDWLEWIDQNSGLKPEVDLAYWDRGLPPGLKEAWTPREMDVVPMAGSYLKRVGDTHFELYVKGGLEAPYPEWAGLIERRLSSVEGIAEHRKFFIPSSYFQRGNGSRMIRRSALLYRDLGLEEIHTKAFGIGKYVWARAGYEFANELVAEEVNRVVSNFAQELGLSEAPLPFLKYPWLFAGLDLDETTGTPITVTGEAVKRVLDTRAFQRQQPTIRDGGTGIPASKALMIYADYNDWDGILRLGDESSGLERLLSYTEGAES